MKTITMTMITTKCDDNDNIKTAILDDKIERADTFAT